MSNINIPRPLGRISLSAALCVMSAIGAGLRADEIAVTVYNSDLGVISESRKLEFKRGLGRVEFRDVPSQIDATSVGFRALDAPGAVTILEQNYQFDLVSPEKIFDRYIDESVELTTKEGVIYAGTLLSRAGQGVVLRDSAGGIQIISSGSVERVNLPKLPTGLITRPTLLWDYTSTRDGALNCEVSYQTGGLTWSAEYVGVLNAAETKMDLSGWSSIDNTSGKTYTDAKLKLIAGDIQRAQRGPERMFKGAMMAEMASADAVGFEEKAFFEYHLYTLPRPSTIANNEIKQISLFEPATASVSKEFYYTSSEGNRNVDVRLKFKNAREAGLGMPLPEGRVRVFKADTDGSRILLGEDRIEHTPKDEEVTLTIGRAFDLVGEETTVDQRSISRTVSETDFKISLRNRKDERATIHIVKDLGRYWEITKTSHEFTKKSASRVQFDIPVDKGAEVAITFTVRYTYR